MIDHRLGIRAGFRFFSSRFIAVPPTTVTPSMVHRLFPHGLGFLPNAGTAMYRGSDGRWALSAQRCSSDAMKFGVGFGDMVLVCRPDSLVLVECGYDPVVIMGQMYGQILRKKLRRQLPPDAIYIEGNPYQDTRFINTADAALGGGARSRERNACPAAAFAGNNTAGTSAPPAGNDTPSSPATDPMGRTKCFLRKL